MISKFTIDKHAGLVAGSAVQCDVQCELVWCVADIRSAQGSRVHLSHGVLRVNRHRPVDWSHHL